MRSPVICLAALCLLAAPALAAPCGDGPGGFEAWKSATAAEVERAGIGQRGIAALMATGYAQKTIAADRGQKSFKLSLDQFMQKRGADTIVAQGRKRKARDAGFYQSLEQGYGVPAGILIAIHGMETGFGGFMGNADVLSAVATLAYDCRRPEFFTRNLYAALTLIDRGIMAPDARGAMHGEWGHTQFLPENVYLYGIDGNGDGRLDLGTEADALASTANYLRGKGWRPGAGYQPGEPNWPVLKEWNAASVYQEALAIMGARIDG